MIAIVDSAGARRSALSCELSMPLRGNWVAHVEMGVDVAPAPGPCSIEIERDGELGVVDRFVGTLRYGSAWQGRASFVIVGGAGGLVAPIAPRHYAVKTGAIEAALVVADAAAAAGEELAADVDLGSYQLGQWTRAELTPAQTLGLVADAFALGWRVRADGTVWLGVEEWPVAAAADYAFEGSQDPDARTIDVAPNRATLAPGMVVLGQRIVRVTYTVTGGGLRATLLYGDTDRDELAAMVRSVTPPDVYAATYGATVVAQNDDDSIDVTVDDKRLPPLRRIKFRPGVIGARVLLPKDSRVRVGFESSAPSGAFAMAPDADPTASKAVARVDDTVDCGTIALSKVGEDVVILYAPPSGGGFGPASASAQLRGVITSGSHEVFLRADVGGPE